MSILIQVFLQLRYILCHYHLFLQFILFLYFPLYPLFTLCVCWSAESESGRCMGEVLEPSEGVVCGMSQRCQEMMTRPGHTRYALTHQLMYSIVAEMVLFFLGWDDFSHFCWLDFFLFLLAPSFSFLLSLSSSSLSLSISLSLSLYF